MLSKYACTLLHTYAHTHVLIGTASHTDTHRWMFACVCVHSHTRTKECLHTHTHLLPPLYRDTQELLRWEERPSSPSLGSSQTSYRGVCRLHCSAFLTPHHIRSFRLSTVVTPESPLTSLLRCIHPVSTDMVTGPSTLISVQWTGCVTSPGEKSTKVCVYQIGCRAQTGERSPHTSSLVSWCVHRNVCEGHSQEHR